MNVTDLGNAKRFALQHCLDVKFVTGWGWLHWDDLRWRKDATGVISRKAKETALSIYGEILRCNDQATREALAKHAIRSESEVALRHMLELAKTEYEIVATPSRFDLDPLILNTFSGIIDLRTCALREHERADMITRLAPVHYDPTAEAPTWMKFLNRVMDENEDMICFLQRMVGYLLTALTVEQCLFLFYGLGANGKTVFVNILKKLLGDYAMQSPAETFMVKHNSGIPNDVARLSGARMVSVQETETGRRLAEALVKAVTGGDTITARFLHQEYFEFRPAFKLILSTNHKPRITGRDHGIWRRVKLIPFSITIPKDEQDPELENKITAELAGVFNWALAGCLSWQKQGLGMPTEVVLATEAYKDECADNVSLFVSDQTIPGEKLRIGAKTFYDSYLTWCNGNGEEPVLQKNFKLRLQDLGFYQKRTGANGGIEWHWIGAFTEVLKGTEVNSEVFPMRAHNKNYTKNASVDFRTSVNTEEPPILDGE